MLYAINFAQQSRHGMPDVDGDSIQLTKEQYLVLPELSHEMFDEQCEFAKKKFSEQVRSPEKSFPAVWITNPEWKVDPPQDSQNIYVHKEFCWVFVCIDVAENLWIAFQYHDAVTIDDACCSTVSVSNPTHGEVYRLDEGCKELVRKFY